MYENERYTFGDITVCGSKLTKSSRLRKFHSLRFNSNLNSEIRPFTSGTKMLQIQENISLENFNTFGIEVFARYFVEINNPNELVELFMDPKWFNMERLVLGGGSNMLFRKDFEGLVIRINIRGIETS